MKLAIFNVFEAIQKETDVSAHMCDLFKMLEYIDGIFSIVNNIS
jgi:hypothetical protein